MYFTLAGYLYSFDDPDVSGFRATDTFVGGPYTFDITLTKKRQNAGKLFEIYQGFLGHELKVLDIGWKGFVSEMEINYGSFRYRRSLIENFANKVRVEYSATGPTYTSYVEDAWSQSQWGTKEYTHQAHFLTASDAATYAQRLLDERAYAKPQLVGGSEDSEIITLRISALGYFFKANWVPVPSMSYALNASDALNNLFTTCLPNLTRHIVTNTQQVVGPPADDAIEYARQIVTFTPDFSYYRIWIDKQGVLRAANRGLSEFITVVNGVVQDPLSVVQPGFIQDRSIPIISTPYPIASLRDILFVDVIEYSWNQEEKKIIPKPGQLSELLQSSIVELYLALNRDNFIANREEEERLRKEAEEARKRERERQGR